MNYPNEPFSETIPAGGPGSMPTADPENGTREARAAQTEAPAGAENPVPDPVPQAGNIPAAGMPMPGQPPFPPAGYPVYPAQPAAPGMPPYMFWDPLRGKRKALRSAVNRAGAVPLAAIVVMELLSMGFVLLARTAINRNILDVNSYQTLVFWMQTFLSPLSFLLPVLVYLKAGRRSVGDLLHFEKGNPLFKILCVVAGVGISMAANIPGGVLSTILDRLGFATAPDMTPASFSWEIFIPHVLAVVVIAPLIEEFVFRGILLSSLEKYGQLFAIVTSGILFGLMHGDIVAALVASLSGMAFGFIYVKTRNLWVTVSIHAVYNVLAIASSYVPFFFDGETAEQITGWMNLAVMLLGAVAVVLLLIFHRRKLFGAPARRVPANPQPASIGIIGSANDPQTFSNRQIYAAYAQYLDPNGPATFAQTLQAWFTSISFWVSVLYVVYTFISFNFMF